MEETSQPSSSRVNSLMPFSFGAQCREIGERIAQSAADDFRQARDRAGQTTSWLMERDRRFTETSTAYVQGAKTRSFSALDLVIAEVGVVLACFVVILGAQGGMPISIIFGLFLISATLFAAFAKQAVEDLISEVEPEVAVEIRNSFTDGKATLAEHLSDRYGLYSAE